jgi:hypothetical protein
MSVSANLIQLPVEGIGRRLPVEGTDKKLEAIIDHKNTSYTALLYTNVDFQAPPSLDEVSSPSTMETQALAPPTTTPVNVPAAFRTHDILSDFTTILLHLGRIEPTESPDVDEDMGAWTPYAAVCKLSNGRVEGIFAVPVNGPRHGTWVTDDGSRDRLVGLL